MFIDSLAWRDSVEILFFATAVYYFSLWLKKDRHKNLLGYFYSYCLIAFTAYQANLSTVTTLLCVASPVVILLFIVLHQTTLQKNFVTLRNIVPAHKDTTDWLEIVIRSCLVALNNNKEIACVIEHQDSLQEHLTTPLTLNAHVKEDLLNIVFESQSFNQQQLVWINSRGMLLGMNAQWHTLPEKSWEFATHTTSLDWQQAALFYTSKTDALLFHIAPTTRTFAIVVHGKLFDAIPTSNALPFIKKYLTDIKTGEKNYGTTSEKRIFQQRTP
jgi:hypothetical protein